MKNKLIKLLLKNFGSELKDYFEPAIYWYCILNYDGMNDELYEIQCNSSYRPSIIGSLEKEDAIVQDMVKTLEENSDKD